MFRLTKRQAAILLGVILLVIAGCCLLYRHNADWKTRLQQATVLTEEQARNINSLQNELSLSKQNAEMLAAAVAEAKAGERQPEVKFIVQAPTVQAAAKTVAEQINQQDKTLPPLALEKTDRTLIVPNNKKTPETNWDVGVFKVNNYRNWEWAVGYGWHDRDRYMPVELQRNYSKDRAMSAEVHIKDTGKLVGGEVKYVIKTDRLFFLF
ncbi:hypothetical protein [Sporomusa sp.]|uniref:hypothetical protein n=1 Tax=Sporomusa sp. TaxID=2078658 RepID=UPI002C513DF1|nr:hypothetical protein [Sporomusa sp.]HWR09890.1 hypothetical protein [Sporomusa sp.]